MNIYHEFSRILLEDSPSFISMKAMACRHPQACTRIDNPAPPAGIGYNSQDWYIPTPLRRTEVSAQ